MSKSKYYEAKNAEVVYFVSNSEKTLPSREKILEEIERCIPSEYDIVNHRATYNRSFKYIEEINYHVEKIDGNRYSISVYYNIKPQILGYVLGFGGLIIGGAVGYSYLAEIGAFFGAIAGVIIISLFTGDTTKPMQVCDRIVNTIREYERAHLVNVNNK